MILPNPWMILGVVVAVGASYGYGHHRGWWERDAEMQIEIAKQNDLARHVEREMTAKLNAKTSELMEATNVINQKQSDLDRAIRNGRVRLPAQSCPQAPGNASAPAPDRDQGPTESERETLRLIAEIVADGDRAIVQLNACIDSYNEVREKINFQGK